MASGTLKQREPSFRAVPSGKRISLGSNPDLAKHSQNIAMFSAWTIDELLFESFQEMTPLRL